MDIELTKSERGILRSLLGQISKNLDWEEKAKCYIVNENKLRFGLERDEMDSFKALCAKIGKY